jgi:hypothetical protein
METLLEVFLETFRLVAARYVAHPRWLTNPEGMSDDGDIA